MSPRGKGINEIIMPSPPLGSDELKILCVDDSTYNLFVMQEIIKLIDGSARVETALNG
jgi:hypothetical protein